MRIKSVARAIRVKLWDKLLIMLSQYPSLSASSDDELIAISVDRLRSSVAQTVLPNAQDTDVTTAEWRAHCLALSENIQSRDPREFLKWPEVQHTMFVAHAPYIKLELDFLRSRSDWKSRWKPALHESRLGAPTRFIYAPYTSANLIHHAYQLARWEDAAGIQVEKMTTIFEFGGGYGSVCRLSHNLGFRGTYVIYDQEPFSSLQTFFLSSPSGPRVPPLNSMANGGFMSTSSTEDVRKVLDSAPPNLRLFIATWSLSESPLAVREKHTQFIRNCDFLLICFQDVFAGMNNHHYFSSLMEERRDLSIRRESISHLQGNTMMFGTPLMH
jgi:hypothetical protein